MPARTPQAGADRPKEQPDDERELLGDDATTQQASAMSDEDMRKRIAELEAELELSKSSEVKALEQLAEAQAAAENMIFNTSVDEVFAGNRDDGADMWKYKIDLSPSGGVQITLNGIPYYHGEVYTFDTGTLRTIKEIVARTWDHERNIHGNRENAYWREQHVVLSGRTGGRR